MIHSPGQLHLLELTVCWEDKFSSAQLRKESKHLHLLEQACTQYGNTSHPIHNPGWMQRLHRQQEPPSPFCPGTNQPEGTELSLTNQFIKIVIEESHAIWALQINNHCLHDYGTPIYSPLHDNHLSMSTSVCVCFN